MKLWDINRTIYKVSDFISWQKSGSLILAPKYQRRAVWTPQKKSYLLDTVIKGLPIPIVFIRERNINLDSLEQKREIVDGQQRIRTILSFVDKTCLKDYRVDRDEFVISRAHNKELAGKTFLELDSDIKRRIIDYQISVHILPDNVDDKELITIFSRLNSTGMQLNPQELRNAEFFGYLKTSIYNESPAQLTRWIAWKIFNEQQISRMDEAELTSELYMLIMYGITANSQSALRKFYIDYDNKFDELENVEIRFRNIFDALEDYMGEEISKSIFNQKSMFYILFAVFYDLMYGLNSTCTLNTAAKRINQDDVKKIITKGKDLLDPKRLAEIVETGTRRATNKPARDALFQYLRN